MVKTLVTVAVFVVVLAALKFFGVMINVSPSMPLGIYVKKFSAIKRGDIVAICLDHQQAQLGLQRHYLKPGFACNGAQPLIKKVIAIPGDVVQLTDHSITVNGHVYFYPTFYQDSRGHSLSAFPRGIYKMSNSYWLLGTHNPHSWDSRYWGPVSAENIIENLYPFTFKY